MTSDSYIALAFVTGAIIQSGTPPAPSTETFVPPSAVSFTISVSQISLRVGPQIPVTYRIVNVGKTALYVPRGFAATGCLEMPAPPHLEAWLRSESGEVFKPGYGGSCATSYPYVGPTLAEHLAQGAILLAPGDQVEGVLLVSTTIVTGLPPGAYLIHALLRGWTGEEFSLRNREQLRASKTQLLGGVVSATPIQVTLTSP